MAAEHEFIDLSDAKRGLTRTVDSVEQVFTIRIRSSHGVGTDDMRNLIQTKHEVLDIEQVNRKVFVQ